MLVSPTLYLRTFMLVPHSKEAYLKRKLIERCCTCFPQGLSRQILLMPLNTFANIKDSSNTHDQNAGLQLTCKVQRISWDFETDAYVITQEET